MKTTYKLGQIIEFKEYFPIEAMISKTKLNVKEGDRAIVTRTGFRILTGEARGKLIYFHKDEEAKGCDYSNISKLIFNRINGVFGLGMLLEDEEIEQKEFLEEIEDVLLGIL